MKFPACAAVAGLRVELARPGNADVGWRESMLRDADAFDAVLAGYPMRDDPCGR